MDAIKLPAVSTPPPDSGATPAADSVIANQSELLSAGPAVLSNPAGLAFAAALLDELVEALPPAPAVELPPDEPGLGQLPADDGNPLPLPDPSGGALAAIMPPVSFDPDAPISSDRPGGRGVPAALHEFVRPASPARAAPVVESEAPTVRPAKLESGAESPLPRAETPRPNPGFGAVEHTTPTPRPGGDSLPVTSVQFGAQAPEQATYARTAEAPKITIPVRVDAPGWGEALATRITWLAREGVQVAELRLNPPQLGPVEIKISVSNNEAQIAFTSHHGAVREALGEAVPRLREMLEQSGIRLGDVDVSARDARADTSSEGHEPHGEARAAQSTDSEDDTGFAAEDHASGVHLGLVDHYV